LQTEDQKPSRVLAKHHRNPHKYWRAQAQRAHAHAAGSQAFERPGKSTAPAFGAGGLGDTGSVLRPSGNLLVGPAAGAASPAAAALAVPLASVFDGNFTVPLSADAQRQLPHAPLADSPRGASLEGLPTVLRPPPRAATAVGQRVRIHRGFQWPLPQAVAVVHPGTAGSAATDAQHFEQLVAAPRSVLGMIQCNMPFAACALRPSSPRVLKVQLVRAGSGVASTPAPEARSDVRVPRVPGRKNKPRSAAACIMRRR
jgi:hypothetical protein